MPPLDESRAQEGHAPAWDITRAKETYNIAHWSGGYFDINDHGHLMAKPDRRHAGIDLHALTAQVQAAGLSLPVLVRFTDILRDRVDTLCHAFAHAMSTHQYTANYTAVYPIKVNQQRSVVDCLLQHGGERVGLEAGSKPELMAVLARVTAGGVVICNGYKDREYLRLALIGRRLGLRVFIVVEKLSELELVLDEAQRMGVAPLIGVRARMASIGAGKWQNTGGEKSKFGLSAAQTLMVVERLRRSGRLEWLQLLHFHLGSQIANIQDIQRGMREAARYYAELRRLGAPLNYVDVGGGLGVDYEGTRSRSFCSMNYSVQEYANNVVHVLAQVCAECDLPHPHIITESGRAMTAHHAMLITHVIDSDSAPDHQGLAAPADNAPRILQDLWRGYSELTDRSALEAYHDAAHWLGEAQGMYTHGVLSLEQRAHAEQIYFATLRTVRLQLPAGTRAHREVLDEINDKLADKYFCNFSIFQSIPDVWAIDQIFPVVPLHRLNEMPTRRVVIEDLTCDSDGCIDYYVDRDTVETTIPLHSYTAGEPYLLGIFLVGAYQEILGDMHNLLGDTDAVDVELDADGGHRLIHTQRGDSVADVLRYVHYAREELLAAYQLRIEQAGLTAAERAGFLEEITAGLDGYTYLEE